MLKSLLSDSYSHWLPVASCCFSCTLVKFISSYFFASSYLLPSIVQVSITAKHLNLATKLALCKWFWFDPLRDKDDLWSLSEGPNFPWSSQMSGSSWEEFPMHYLGHLKCAFSWCDTWVVACTHGSQYSQDLLRWVLPLEYDSYLADHVASHPNSNQNWAEVEVC